MTASDAATFALYPGDLTAAIWRPDLPTWRQTNPPSEPEEPSDDR